MLDEVISELAASRRDDRDQAQQAVRRLYSSAGMLQPRVHWASSVYAAMRLAETWRPPNEGSADFELRERFREVDRLTHEAASALFPDEKLSDGRPRDAGREIPLYLACLLEADHAAAALRRQQLSPPEYYRLQVGQSLADDQVFEPLNFGTIPFPHDWSRDFALGYTARLEAAARMQPNTLKPTLRWRIDAWFALARDAYWAFFTDTDVVLADPPRALALDERGRPHCEDGPALVTGDAHEIYAMKGTLLSRDTVLAPSRQQLRDIELEPDTNARAIMIERFGLERYLREAGMLLWNQDEFGELYYRPQMQDDPLLLVKVRNSTPEPDGTIREYVLRVPPHVATAREAIAWTFGMTEAEYAPCRET